MYIYIVFASGQEGKTDVEWGDQELAGTHKHDLEPHGDGLNKTILFFFFFLPLALLTKVSCRSQGTSSGS